MNNVTLSGRSGRVPKDMGTLRSEPNRNSTHAKLTAFGCRVTQISSLDQKLDVGPKFRFLVKNYQRFGNFLPQPTGWELTCVGFGP